MFYRIIGLFILIFLIIVFIWEIYLDNKVYRKFCDFLTKQNDLEMLDFIGANLFDDFGMKYRCKSLSKKQIEMLKNLLSTRFNETKLTGYRDYQDYLEEEGSKKCLLLFFTIFFLGCGLLFF